MVAAADQEPSTRSLERPQMTPTSTAVLGEPRRPVPAPGCAGWMESVRRCRDGSGWVESLQQRLAGVLARQARPEAHGSSASLQPPGGEASPAGHSPLARCEQAPWHDGSCTGGVIASGGLCLEVGHVHVSKKLSSPPAWHGDFQALQPVRLQLFWRQQARP